MPHLHTSFHASKKKYGASDLVIRVLHDIGVWPERESFNDRGLGEVTVTVVVTTVGSVRFGGGGIETSVSSDSKVVVPDLEVLVVVAPVIVVVVVEDLTGSFNGGGCVRKEKRKKIGKTMFKTHFVAST
uniref:Uncharacterized protein n=1 Tax=Tanacetum cinerariifolium TaxID=118510 RepID=A0A6L2MY54_TANCI|nr:hypothetical protein [Tanacetum cinerariifolium]